jgi:hypothetical protein
MTNDTSGEEFASFLSLSEYLTGEIGLDRGLAQSHFHRMQVASDANAIAKLLLQWREAKNDPSYTAEMVGNILADAVLGPLAKTLILLWYTGGHQERGWPVGDRNRR